MINGVIMKHFHLLFNATIFQRNPHTAFHETEGCITLAQIWCKILPRKGIFLKT